jgi:RNA polymerase sigma factor (TIGR02999 family)
MTSDELKKFQSCGRVESIMTTCLGRGQKTVRLTRFDTHGRKGFQNPLRESGEDGALGPLSLSVILMNDVTRILSAIEQGDSQAAEQLLPLVYDELRKLAAAKLAQEKPGQTLQPTALVHEAYLRLVDSEKVQHWNSRGHFFAAAAEAMRRILIGNARRKQAQKRGGRAKRVDLDAIELADHPASEKLLVLEDALIRLAPKDPVKGELVKLRYFGGLTSQEAAGILGISTATADRYWAYARAWLQNEITAALES